MENNKSIDGLVSRRSKKTTTKTIPKKTVKKSSSSPKAKRSTKPKSIKIEEPKIIKTEIVEDTIEKTAEENLNPSPEQSVENFLEPVKAFDFDEETKKLKESKKTQLKPLKKIKKKPGKLRKILSIIFLIIILAIIGVIVWAVLWGNDIIAKITGGQGTVLDLIFINETYEPLKTDENGRTNILAFGTSGYNMEGDVGNGFHDGAALTDSIMLLSLDQETGDLAMLSLPRDLKAKPTCTATGKINEVYWCNNMNGDNEQAGAEALMTEVGSILGVDFQYYAHLNWGSLVQIVDTLGGITVTLDEGIYDYYQFDPGVPYELDGEVALALARSRYGTTSGDFSRGASQQKILIGIKNKLLEKNLSIPDYLSLASALGDNLRTNFSVEELKTIAHLASSVNLDSMRQISLIEPEQLMTTGMVNGISYVLPSAGIGNYGKIQKYVSKMISSDPRIYEESTILILNGTETNGLANSEKLALENEGYINISVSNAPEGQYNDKYSLYSLNNKPGTKKLLESYYNSSAKSPDDLPENISREYDFVIILGGKPDDE